MAKLKFEGLDAYTEQLRKMSDKSTGMIKRAVWEGARVIADATAAEIAALPVVKDHMYPPQKLPIHGVTAAQKRGLLNGLGLAGMKNESGYINTKLGFDGYNATKTKAYPNGQPNALIARVVNSGSSSRAKIPFVNKAVKSAKERAEAAMSARFDADTRQIID